MKRTITRQINRTINRTVKSIFKVHRGRNGYNPFPPVITRISGKALFALIATVLSLLLYRTYFAPQASAPVDASLTPTSEIRCIDGDTFAYDGVKVRLLAIDTPETVAPNKPVQPFGQEASDRTCSLLQNATSIELKYDAGNEVDKYDRKLNWVYIDGVLLQETLLSEGLAEIKYVDKKTIDPTIHQQLENAQNEAQLHQRGMWGN